MVIQYCLDIIVLLFVYWKYVNLYWITSCEFPQVENKQYLNVIFVTLNANELNDNTQGLFVVVTQHSSLVIIYWYFWVYNVFSLLLNVRSTLV